MPYAHLTLLALTLLSLFACDVDSDRYGVLTTDSDGDGFDSDVDCDDENADVHPDADEVCDGVDNDCDDLVDDDDELAEGNTYYGDSDNDGYGGTTYVLTICGVVPDGYVMNAEDCDDLDESINPAAAELCDGEDNDCDGSVDENDAEDALTWYADSDGDGHGDEDSTVVACSCPAGYLDGYGDCDDSDADSYPGATETAYDGIDQDCDGDDLTDVDEDGYISDEVSGTDCDDDDASINPAASEICDEVDNDCDGDIDEDDALDVSTWYEDADGDLFGTPTNSIEACYQPSGFVDDSSDCNDEQDYTNPDAEEIC